MTEISEFFYQIFAALLFCAGISLAVFWADSFSDGTEGSYKAIYETVAYINDNTETAAGDGSRVYARDEILAMSLINSVDKFIFPGGIYSNSGGNTDELRRYLKESAYKGKVVCMPEETAIYLTPDK